MPIELDKPQGGGAPVIKRKVIGEEFVGGLIRFDNRDQQDDNGNPIPKLDYKTGQPTGKNKQELVVHLLTLNSTMQAGLGQENMVPERGQVVRLILKGGGYGQWIDSLKAFYADNPDLGRGFSVGDLVGLGTDEAIRYRSMGDHAELGKMTAQAEVNDYFAGRDPQDRSESVGFRGPLGMQPATDAAFTVECEQAYYELEKQGIQLDEPAGPFDEAPPAQASAPTGPAPSAGSFFADANS